MNQRSQRHSVRHVFLHPMGRVVIVPCVILILAAGLLFPRGFSAYGVSPAPVFVPLAGSVSPQVTSSRFVGHHTALAVLTIAVMLFPNNQSKQDDLLSQLYDPHSPLYHHWLRKGAFDATFGPTSSQRALVTQYLTQSGLQLLASPGRLFVVAKGTQVQLERNFHTTINDYRRADGSLFFANSAPIQIPASWQGIVQGVFGLSNATKSEPLLIKQETRQKDQQIAHYGGGPAGGLTPTQIAGFYDASPISVVLGKGVTLSLFELSGYTPGDAVGYESQFGLTTVPQQYILVNGGPTDHSGAGEVALDVEMMAALASSVDRIQLYEAPNSDLGIIAGYYQIAQDDTAQVTSTSWGTCEQITPSQDSMSEAQSFKIMALQGQSMFAASGDNGAFACLASKQSNGAVQVLDPASQPYVTAVGGTSLAAADPGSNPNPTYPNGMETTWNTNCTAKTCYFPNGSGGGGGNSKLWKRPTYQSGPGVNEGKYSKSGAWCKQAAGTACREVPDVSLNADPASGYAVYCTDAGDTKACSPTGWVVIGGTSAAAPLWAAITALADSYLFAHNSPALGFANPYLYQLNATTGYSNVFHDIGKGKGTNGYFPTGAGYDMATGMGSIDIYRFVLQSIYPPFKQSVFVGAGNHWVYALSASTGTPLWHYVMGSTPSPSVVVNGVVYVSSDELYALNASTGSLLWRYPFGNSNNNSKPTVVNGVVYAGSSDGYLYALNASTGSLLWRYQTGEGHVWSASVVGGVVYSSASSPGGFIYALNASDGTLLWQQSVSSYLSSQPVVSNGVIYFTFAQFIEAIQTSDGSFLWSQQEGSNVALGTPVVVNGTIYVPSNGLYGLPGSMLALNGDNGVLLWSYYDTHSSYVYTPLVLNGVVDVDFYDGVYALNAADGTLQWSSTIDPSVASLTDAPTVNNGILYCGSSDGNIRTLNVSTGASIGQYLVSSNANGYVGDPTIAP